MPLKTTALISLLTFATGAAAQTAAPTSFAGSADVQAQVKAMEAEMKPGQGFAWKPLVQSDGATAAIEIWRTPGRPAVHPTEGEYAIVLAGEGELVTGGTMTEPEVTNPTLTQGGKIVGGTTRAVHMGDVMLIPAGTPHWFGIRGRELVLLGIKLPHAAK